MLKYIFIHGPLSNSIQPAMLRNTGVYLTTSGSGYLGLESPLRIGVI